jgi:hypothetical protein
MANYLKFCGFYESAYTHCDLEYDTCSNEGVNPNILDYLDVWEYINYNLYRVELSKAILEELKDSCGFSLEFLGIESPKSYNYTTDLIKYRINDFSIISFINTLKANNIAINDFKQYIKSNDKDNIQAYCIDFLYHYFKDNIISNVLSNYDIHFIYYILDGITLSLENKGVYLDVRELYYKNDCSLELSDITK